ncbi:hypothetical protein GCM10022286_16420 [Gryllotalpicola daejeonensis]|uniref:FHA domain-containing protein n=1 Tax=Gryllotalpicola daejeonensis TaxID=993087 RepID=A0ABP7ZJN9_9MICO
MTPSYSDAVDVSLAGAAAMAALVVPLVVALVIWLVVVPLGLHRIFEALSVDRSRAWIPFVNIATVYRLGGLSEFWLIALVIPLSSWLGALMLFIATHRINRRLGRSGWYTVLAVVAWWVWTLALGLQHRVDLRAASEPLVWSMQRPPQGPLTIPSQDDSQQPLEETPVSAAGFIAPMPGIVEPDASQLPTRDPQPVPVEPVIFAAEQREAPQSTIAPEQREAPRLETSLVDSAKPNGDPTPAAAPRVETIAPAASPVIAPPPLATPPYSPQVLATPPAAPAPSPAAAPAPVPAPAQPVVPSREPEPAPAAPPLPDPAQPHEAAADLDHAADDDPYDDDATIISGARADATVVSSRRRARWWIQTSMGARVELTGTSAILGRRPSPHPLYPGAQLIAVTDDALSVSATHAVLEYVGGEWQVTDLDSTNGVWLLDPNTNEESELGARNRARVTPQFMLGELGVKVVQGA